MSRKREKQRESRRELARQLGVPADDVPEELRSHARVCEPEVALTVEVVTARRGLLARALPLDVHAALFVVDAAGIRHVRSQHLRGRGGPGDVVLAPVSAARGEVKVRYHRPGHFFLVVLVTEGASDAEARDHAGSLTDPTRLLLELPSGRGTLREVTSPALERPTRAELALADAGVGRRFPEGIALRFSAAAALRVPAAHRVQETLELPLLSRDGRFEARARVALRL